MCAGQDFMNNERGQYTLDVKNYWMQVSSG